MDNLIIGKDAPPTPGLAPTTVSWKTDGKGEFNEHSAEEKTYRALFKALTAHYSKKTVAQVAKSPPTQFSIQGPHYFLASCNRTTAGKQSTYHAIGRAKIWIHDLKADNATEEMVSFDIVFRDSRDQYQHRDVEIVSGNVDKMPRGTPLVP